MPRHVKDARIETREARRKLGVQSEPYWRAIVQGAHVGYYKGARRGAWLVRWRKPEGGYQKATLGEADDTRDADGVNVLTYAQAQQKALAQIEAWQRPTDDSDATEVGEARSYTVADAITAYERWLSKHRKPTAVRDLRAANRAHIAQALGKLELAKLSTTKLRHWHEGLAEKPRRLRTGRGAKQQRYRPVADDPESIRRRRDTANRIRTILFAALNRAFEDGKVASDAAWRKVKPFRETGSARVRYLSLDECKRLMNACEPDFRQLVRGALVTGARYGELCRADVSDFNADASALLVRESKGGKPRWGPLDDAGAAFLEDITAGRAPTEPLFVRADGERWRPSHQTRPLQAACIAAKIAPCGFHQLRHSYASHRVMAGMPLIAIANVLGHSDTRMVEKHYGHLSPSYIREAVRATALDLGPIEGNVATLRPGGGGMSKFGANSEKLEKLYRETGNPLYVWAALVDYQVCPDGAPLPAWIMEYLRQAAMALEFIADVEQPSEASRRVNAALRLTRSGRNEFAEYRQDIRGLNAAHIHDIRKELFRRPGGRPETAVVVSNQWLEKALGLKSEGPDRRNPEDQRSRRVGELIARGRKLRSIMTG